MLTKSYIINGMSFGDEGKGSFIDALAHKESIRRIVRYNGGSQASHTVTTPEGLVHKFSQLGSGMFVHNAETFLTANMVINLENLVTEAEVFADKINRPVNEILSQIIIDPECYVVTPLHKLINRMRELTLGNDRRGSVGTGVSEVPVLRDLGLGVQVKDIFFSSSVHLKEKITSIFSYVLEYALRNEEVMRDNTPDGDIEKLCPWFHYLTSVEAVQFVFILYHDLLNDYDFVIGKLKTSNVSTIYEGSQGVLLDAKYGIRPNTTMLDTTNHYAVNLLHDEENVTKIGIVKAFFSRHGKGAFPSEDTTLTADIIDTNQTTQYWNGSPRVGWFDVVLTKYALSVNPVDTLWISAIDQLSRYDQILVCVGYTYEGEIGPEFSDIFEYGGIDTNAYYITGIKSNHINLSMYLDKCTPVFIGAAGWNQPIQHCKTKDELPPRCLGYIELLSSTLDIDISCVSVGPTREDKIWI